MGLSKIYRYVTIRKLINIWDWRELFLSVLKMPNFVLRSWIRRLSWENRSKSFTILLVGDFLLFIYAYSTNKFTYYQVWNVKNSMTCWLPKRSRMSKLKWRKLSPNLKKKFQKRFQLQHLQLFHHKLLYSEKTASTTWKRRNNFTIPMDM